jgi:hypothetical protein
MLFDVFVARRGVVEALVKEETTQFAALVSLLAVHTCEGVKLFVREVFNDFAVSLHRFAEGFQADIVPCYDTLLLLLAHVIPNVEEIPVKVSFLIRLAFKLGALAKILMVDFVLVATTEVF